MAPGRREQGHGGLTHKALKNSLPSQINQDYRESKDNNSSSSQDFQHYSYRINSITTGSNGSSSMASVCGGSLALTDAGVNLSEGLVAGISMGLLTLPVNFFFEEI